MMETRVFGLSEDDAVLLEMVEVVGRCSTRVCHGFSV